MGIFFQRNSAEAAKGNLLREGMLALSWDPMEQAYARALGDARQWRRVDSDYG